jgi:hypothetical protein
VIADKSAGRELNAEFLCRELPELISVTQIPPRGPLAEIILEPVADPAV